MGSLIVTLGRENPRFTVVGCINVVVASNAGGSFTRQAISRRCCSGNRDVVTEQGVLEFWTFFLLFLPALAAWLVPAMVMQVAVPKKGAWLPLAGHTVVRRGASS